MNKTKLLAAVAVLLAVLLCIQTVWMFRVYPLTTAAARVNGEPISKDELYRAMIVQFGERAAERLISEKLIAQKAAEYEIEVTPLDIELELEFTKNAYPSEEAFYETLIRWGLTLQEFKDELKTRVLIEKILGPDITLTEEAVRNYFEENLDRFRDRETVRASHILVADRETAETVLQRLEQGQSFGELVREFSVDEETKQRGGDVGTFPRGIMEPAFEDAAFQLEAGETSGIIETVHGYHIIQVTERNRPPVPEFEAVKEQVYQWMFKEEVSGRIPEWIAQLEAEAEIELLFKKKLSLEDFPS